MDTLIKKYKKNLPKIEACWDLSDEAIDHNDINSDIKKRGLIIYSCRLDCLFKGIYRPQIYYANTLWRKHNNTKIAKVIYAWEQKKNLSPIFFVKHGKEDLALVADGKHRLTVSAAIAAQEIYFMVSRTDTIWVEKAFPNAIKKE